MGDVTINQLVVWIIAAAGAIVSIAKAAEIIAKLRPSKAAFTRLDAHDKLLANDHQRLKTLEEKQTQQDKFQAVMCRVMLAQLNHELSGNDVKNLKSARDELNDYLTER